LEALYSSRYSPKQKSELTIPAGANLSSDPTSNSQINPSRDEEFATPQPVHQRKSTPREMTQQELRERLSSLRKQGEEIRAKYPQTPVRLVQLR
jgi:hypothetical protein